MDKQRIEIGDCPLLPVIGRERIVPMVGVIESRVEAAEEGSQGQVDAPVAVINGRVDEHGLVFVIAEEVAGPEIAMEEGGWLGWEDSRQVPVEPLELVPGGVGKEVVLGGELYLGFEAAVDEEIGPAAGGGIVLGQGAHVVVVVEAEKPGHGWCGPIGQ